MVTFYISCKDLKNLDFGTNLTDPLVKVFIKEGVENDF